VILFFIVYSAPAYRLQLLDIGKGESLVITRSVLVHDPARADVALRRVKESGTQVEKGGNPNIGDPILNDAALLCAFDVSAPHQTREMLGDPSLGQPHHIDDLRLRSRTIEQHPKDPDPGRISQTAEDSGDEFIVLEGNRNRFDDGWASHGVSVVVVDQ